MNKKTNEHAIENNLFLYHKCHHNVAEKATKMFSYPGNM